MPRLSASETPTTCEVKPGLTNSPLRPVSGWMRTTGCSTGGISVTVAPSHWLPRPARRAEVGTPLAVAVVHRHQVVHEPTDRRRQRVVGELGVGPAGVATGRRQRHGAQDRRRRRGGHERDVGVPDVGEGELRVAAVDAVDLARGPARTAPPGARPSAHPAATAKATWASSVRLLPAEEQHLVLDQGPPDAAHLRACRGRRGRRRAPPRRSSDRAVPPAGQRRHRAPRGARRARPQAWGRAWMDLDRSRGVPRT